MQKTVNSNNFLIKICGLFLAAIFILNTSFGNAVMNITFFGLPANQLFIGLFLILLGVFNLIKIPRGAPLFLYIWLVFALFIWLPVGFLNYGIVAGRDATQVLDALVFLLAFTVLFHMSTHQITKSLEKIIVIGITLELLDRIYLFQFTNITVSNAQVIGFFGGTIGSHMIIMTALWFGVMMRGLSSQRIRTYLILMSFLLILLHQNRFLYVSAIFTLLFYLYLVRKSFFNKSTYKALGILILLVMIAEFLLVPLMQYLFILFPDSDYLTSDRLFKFGIESFSLIGILEHLLTGFGVESEAYSGAARGVFHRLEWWTRLFIIMFSDVQILLLGMGYGMPLTETFMITELREPHNSYISVFCRNGLILFIIWITFHIFTALKSISIIRKNHYQMNEVRLLIVSLLVTTSTYIKALVEPAFELPPTSITTYMFLALSTLMLARLKMIKNNIGSAG